MSTKTDKIDRLAQLTQANETTTGASLWREALRRLKASKMAVIGAAIIAVFVVVAIVGPWLAPHAPTAQTWRGEVFANQGQFVGARGENWFGLDHLGRDLFSRMLVGARQTLLVGVVSMLIGLVVGALIGMLSGAAATLGGRAGARIDTVVMRFIDILLSLPSLLLAVSIAAVMGQSLTTVMIAVGVVQIPIFARLLRGSMLAQGGSDYVLAAKALGVRRRRIVLTQILPNSLSPVIVQATLSLATAIIEAAALSYLGLGNPDPAVPEWGVMLAQAQRFFDNAPMMAVYPAVGIIITALGFTLLGEAMREALDPKLRG
ncbi:MULTISPECIES: ABC transporter permease [Streptomyces]|uniref:Glutathione transport system permease protein GsiD n=2 Tax=Streptomyces TaxID=1883 RepID=A0A1D8G6V2_9ACTN|nr:MULTISPECIES: ABC transporter permease [Streptomyces]AOT61169.1 Glutathione transport system permease protein GsiD [Streptomyces rubrolavendulae]KAF0650165.1 ABC transporter permease [Streptomyces fradiae ATCC 10745 = DSM 40063]OSY51941.1 Glutathione transport system permease protein GsiD [Streptomyces fradiae ATCC 10745 = DSM 40063]QEV14195.1 ABC transporter permease [Streptomyces fradiae ATCC 10745 = DSM 40063]UQS30575.1 ABC transporter permease [Streptomyces fradiae]